MRNETRTLLRSYIKRDLYISEKHYLVSSKPDRKNKRVGRCIENNNKYIVVFFSCKIFIFQSIKLYTKFIG